MLCGLYGRGGARAGLLLCDGRTLSGVTRRAGRAGRPLTLTAGSLSIEPLGRSRWRLRRTRGVSYVFSIVGRRGAGARVAMSSSRRAGPSSGGIRVGAGDGGPARWADLDGRAHLRRSRMGRGWVGGPDAHVDLRACHRADRRSAPRERVGARSAVRRRASARRSGGTATCAAVSRRRAPRPVGASDRRPGPAGTAPARGCGTAGRGSRSSESGRSASAARAGESAGGILPRRASACGSGCRGDSPSTETRPCRR